MITLYEISTEPYVDTVSGIHYIGVLTVRPVIFPDTFWILSGLKYSDDYKIVTRNGKQYYLDLPSADTTGTGVLTLDEWMRTAGNYAYYSYWNGTHKNNPSGNRNLRRIMYLDGKDMIRYIVDFHWDKYDNCIRRKSILPYKDGVTVGGNEGKEDEDEAQEEVKTILTITILNSNNTNIDNKKVYEYYEGDAVMITNIIKELQQMVDGYTVTFTDADGNIVDSNFNIEKSATYIATWRKNLTITIRNAANGGDMDMKVLRYLKGDKVVLADIISQLLAETEDEGYTCTIAKEDGSELPEEFTLSDDLTIVATWTEAIDNLATASAMRMRAFSLDMNE